MVPDKKRTPDEAWDALEKMALDNDVDRVLGLSEKELDGEIAQAGVDPERVRARARAIADQIEQRNAQNAEAQSGPNAVPPVAPTPVEGPRKTEGGSPPAKVLPLRRARWVVLLAAALGAIALAVMSGGLELASRDRSHEEDRAGHGRSQEDHERAAALRAKASSECAASRWRECLGDLDAARSLDPGGDLDEPVSDMRRAAETGMHAGGAASSSPR
jgi:hypothetical protein